MHTRESVGLLLMHLGFFLAFLAVFCLGYWLGQRSASARYEAGTNTQGNALDIPLDASWADGVAEEATEATQRPGEGWLIPTSLAALAPSACYVADLEAPCIPMPYEMAVDVNRVFLLCEARIDPDQPYRYPKDAIGAAGERGGAQIHPSWEHNPRASLDFVRLGLDYGSEYDRFLFAVALWERSGWGPWSCWQ